MAGITPIVTVGRITLTVEDKPPMVFNELVGLTTEVTLVDVLQAGETGPALSRTPFATKPPTVTLRRAGDSSLDLWTWHESLRHGDVAARRSGALTVASEDGKALIKYQLRGAWPSRLDLAQVKVSSTQVVVETVTFTCDELHRVTP
jgi:phage tail-like protein